MALRNLSPKSIYPLSAWLPLVILVDGNLEDRIAKVIVVPCDQGHYGFSYCGHCNYALDDKKRYDSCPECTYRLVGVETDIMPGGLEY